MVLPLSRLKSHPRSGLGDKVCASHPYGRFHSDRSAIDDRSPGGIAATIAGCVSGRRSRARYRLPTVRGARRRARREPRHRQRARGRRWPGRAHRVARARRDVRARAPRATATDPAGCAGSAAPASARAPARPLPRHAGPGAAARPRARRWRACRRAPRPASYQDRPVHARRSPRARRELAVRGAESHHRRRRRARRASAARSTSSCASATGWRSRAPAFPPFYDLLDALGADAVPAGDRRAAACVPAALVERAEPRGACGAPAAARAQPDRRVDDRGPRPRARAHPGQPDAADVVVVEDDHSGVISRPPTSALGRWLPERVRARPELLEVARARPADRRRRRAVAR